MRPYTKKIKLRPRWLIGLIPHMHAFCRWNITVSVRTQLHPWNDWHILKCWDSLGANANLLIVNVRRGKVQQIFGRHKTCELSGLIDISILNYWSLLHDEPYNIWRFCPNKDRLRPSLLLTPLIFLSWINISLFADRQFHLLVSSHLEAQSNSSSTPFTVTHTILNPASLIAIFLYDKKTSICPEIWFRSPLTFTAICSDSVHSFSNLNFLIQVHYRCHKVY